MQIDANTKRFLLILEKIPRIQKLMTAQAMEILKICKARAFRDQERLCEYGSKSTEMFILLSGNLALLAQDGTQLTSLVAITTVGEMGVITG